MINSTLASLKIRSYVQNSEPLRPSFTIPVCSPPSAQQDAIFELVSMAFNVAVWYTKFASRMAGKEKYVLHVPFANVKKQLFIHLSRVEPLCFILSLHLTFLILPRLLVSCSVSEAEAKDVHRSLKVAAGIFKCLKVR